MKILTIAATPFFSDRGGHMRILNEAKYLQKLGAEVRLCTYHIGENVEGLDIARINGPKSYKKTSPGFSWGKIWLDLKMLFLVRREIKKFQPDAIHAHLYEGLAIGHCAQRLTRKKQIPMVLDLQGNIGEEFESYNKKNNFARKVFVSFSKRVIRWADKIVVSSENVKLPGQHPEVIVDGIDIDKFRNKVKLSGGEAEKIKKIKKWQGDDKLLVYIGGLSDNKGVGELLETFLRSNLKKSGWKLLLGGYGKDEEKYLRFVEKSNPADSVYFAGRVSYLSLPHFLALADAGIDPKYNSTESSGKIANLMAAGLPIICFENEFNCARLGDRGYYLNNMDDLGNMLVNIRISEKIEYNPEELSEEKEVKKLFAIFEKFKPAI